MKANRIQLLVALMLLLAGIAGLVQTALKQTEADRLAKGVVVAEPSVAQIEAEIRNIAEMPRMEMQSGKPISPQAPTPPTRPTPPPTPDITVDLVTWIGLTVALFTPFAAIAWYLDQRKRSTIYEQPLA